MTDPEANRDLVAAAFDAVRRGDALEFFARCAPDIVVVEPDFVPFRGTYRGLAEFQGLMELIGARFDISALQVGELLADDDKVIVPFRIPVRGSKATVRVVEMWTVRDGKATEIVIFYNAANALLNA